MAKKKRAKKAPELESELEEAFYNYWCLYYPSARPVLQHRFHPTRKFRFDFAWPRSKVAVEVNGYGPGHNSLAGMTKDYDRHIEIVKLNWKVIYLTSRHVGPKRIDEVCEEIASILDIKKEVNTYIPYSKRNFKGRYNA